MPPQDPRSGPQPAQPAPQGAIPSAIATGMGLLAGSMVNEGTLSPAQGQMISQHGQGIANRLQHRWWTQEADNFKAEQGATYQQAIQGIQSTMDKEYNAGMKIKDIATQQQAVNGAFQKALMATQTAEVQFLDSMGQFPNNPIIADIGNRLFQARHGSLQELMKGQQGAAEMQGAQAQAQTQGQEARTAETTADFAPKQQQATLDTKAAQERSAGLTGDLAAARIAQLGKSPPGTQGFFYNNVDVKELESAEQFDTYLPTDPGAQEAVKSEAVTLGNKILSTVQAEIRDIDSEKDETRKDARISQFQEQYGINYQDYQDIYSKEGGFEAARAYLQEGIYDVAHQQAKRNVRNRALQRQGRPTQGPTGLAVNEDNALGSVIDPDILKAAGKEADVGDELGYNPESKEGIAYEQLRDAYTEVKGLQEEYEDELSKWEKDIPNIVSKIRRHESSVGRSGLLGGGIPSPAVLMLRRDNPEVLERIKHLMAEVKRLDKESKQLKKDGTKSRLSAKAAYRRNN